MKRFFKRNKQKIEISDRSAVTPLEMVFDSKPDLPESFGYKCQWYAIRTTDSLAVAKSFNLTDTHNANWRTGMEGAYARYYFVAPPVNGWTLVINSLMPDLSATDECNPLEVVNKLSKQYGEAYYFGTHRVVEYHAWIKSRNGVLIRAYGYLGESGETIINEGELTIEEVDNGLLFTSLDVEEPDVPAEEDVIKMAKLWSISPLMENSDYEAAVGIIGIINK